MGGSESGTGLPKAGPHGWLIERETPLSTQKDEMAGAMMK